MVKKDWLTLGSIPEPFSIDFFEDALNIKTTVKIIFTNTNNGI
jgi:hypothetical protein